MNNQNKRKKITTTIDEKLLKRLKILAIKLEKPYNELLDQGIELVLKKHNEEIEEI